MANLYFLRFGVTTRLISCDAGAAQSLKEISLALQHLECHTSKDPRGAPPAP